MPQTTKTTHPTRPELELTFTEDDHRYFDNEGRDYVSVTTLVKSAFPKFDAPVAAERVAKKEGVTPEEIIKRWDKIRDDACEYGTRVHEVGEYRMTDGKSGADNWPRDDKEDTAFKCIASAVDLLRSQFELRAVEQVLFTPKFQIAGTADLIMQRQATIWIIDWKTNKEIKHQGFDMGLPGFECVHNANFWHYAIQTSIYEAIGRNEGFWPKEMPVKRAIVHIPPFQMKPEWIELPDMSNEAMNLIKAAKSAQTVK